MVIFVPLSSNEVHSVGGSSYPTQEEAAATAYDSQHAQHSVLARLQAQVREPPQALSEHQACEYTVWEPLNVGMFRVCPIVLISGVKENTVGQV